jgi:hypothetical protein
MPINKTFGLIVEENQHGIGFGYKTIYKIGLILRPHILYIVLFASVYGILLIISKPN